MNTTYVIGVDFGTDSVRSVLVSTETGEELATSVFEYPRWKAGLYCDAGNNQFRQHPLDYIEGLEYTVRACADQAGPAVAKHVIGLSVDTTGSTPVAVNAHGVPLSLLPEFSENPNAMFILWKDHTSVNEAAESMHTPYGLKRTTCNMSVASIRRNGSGPSCCMSSAKTNRYGQPRTRG